MQQKIQNRKLPAWAGILLVLGIAAFLLVLSQVCAWLSQATGTSLGMFLFWGAGAGAAWLLLNRVVMGYTYTYNGLVLRVERTYGSRSRFAEDVNLRRLKGMGTLEEMKARFPGAKVFRATRRQCPLPELAVAYADGDRVRIAVLQPEEALRAKLMEDMKK